MAADRRPGTRRGRGEVSLPPVSAATAPASSAWGSAGRGGWEAPRVRCAARRCVAAGSWSVATDEATPCRGVGRSRWGSTGGAAKAIGPASRSPFPEGAGGAAVGIGRSAAAAAAPVPAAPAPAPARLGESAAGVRAVASGKPPSAGGAPSVMTAACSVRAGVVASASSSRRRRALPLASVHARPPAPAPAGPWGSAAGAKPDVAGEPPPSRRGGGTRTASTMRGPASSLSSWRGRVSPHAEAHARLSSNRRAGGWRRATSSNRMAAFRRWVLVRDRRLPTYEDVAH